MKLTILSFITLLSSGVANAADMYLLNSAGLGFENYIRVEVSAKIVEAEDRTLQGLDAPFLQSLLYGASKEITLNKQFTDQKAIQAFVQQSLCTESHDVKLSPIRDSGAKGLASFQAKLKPRFITVTGIQFVTGKAIPYSSMQVCAKKL